MEPPSSASALRTQVELALLAGRNLEQIETELLAGGHGDEDEQAAAWLYAWACGAGHPRRRPSPQNSRRRA